MKKSVLFLLSQLIFACGYSQGKISLSGTVTDAQLNFIPRATVHLLNTNFYTLTDNKGAFFFNGLYPGTYQLEASAAGFATVNKTITISTAKNDIHATLQHASKQLNEVIVTAQKAEEDVQQLPVSITALSSGQVEAYQLGNVKDITAIAPNLYSADPGDKRNVTSIRGITTTSYNPSVAIYVDGVNQFSLDTYISTLFDVERIEVLRGPQGSLYGRNAMGGVINVITKSPGNRTEVFASADVGNYGLQRYTAAVRTPLVKDKLFIGIGALYDEVNGYYTNEFNGKSYDKQHSFLGNYYIKYLPSSRWTLTLNVKNNENRNNGAFPLVPGIKEAFDHPFLLNQNALTTLKDDIFNSSLVINYAGRLFNFSSQTAYQSNYRYYSQPIDADFSPLDGISIINNFGRDWNHVKVATQEFKFSSPAATTSSLKWTAGSYLFYNDNPVKQATRFGEDAEMLGMQDKNFSLINTTRAKSFGVAFYGQATYPINKQWKITAGARYDYEHQKQNIKGEYQHDPDPAPVFEFRSDTSATADFDAFSPTVSIAFNPTENHMLYASYSRGYRAGGLTPLSSDPSQPALYPFKPEFSNNIEIGIKNSFLDNKLLWNLAGFYTAIINAQVPTLVLPDAVTITKNTGRLNSRGVETEIMAMPFTGLRLSYSFGYTDARYKNLKIAVNGSEADLKGKQQLFTPEVTSMLAAQYEYKIKNSVSLLAGGEWYYIGTQYFDLANTIRQSGYSILNAKAGVRVKKISLVFWGRNLTDKHYISYAYDFGAVHLGNPLTYGVTASFKL